MIAARILGTPPASVGRTIDATAQDKVLQPLSPYNAGAEDTPYERWMEAYLLDR
jgi:hypothetical protein